MTHNVNFTIFHLHQWIEEHRNSTTVGAWKNVVESLLLTSPPYQQSLLFCSPITSPSWKDWCNGKLDCLIYKMGFTHSRESLLYFDNWVVIRLNLSWNITKNYWDSVTVHFLVGEEKRTLNFKQLLILNEIYMTPKCLFFC